MKARKKSIILVSLLIAISITATLSSAFISAYATKEKIDTDSTNEVDTYIRESISRNNIPGIAVVIVKDGQVTYLAGYGVTDSEDPSPVTPQTIFDIASCSKSFTTLAILLLEKDGFVNLDSPVSSYLQDLKFADPNVENSITVRDLLNHTSGLPGVFSEPMAFHQGIDAMTKLVLAMNKVHLNRPVSSSFEYSNMNYSLLGAIIESVSGNAFEDFIQERIFTPLDMKTRRCKRKQPWKKTGHPDISCDSDKSL